jgi:DNA-binding NarL/FixJ family response regulator
MSRVLIVEDDTDARQSLARSLVRGGFQVIEAASLPEARSRISDHSQLSVVVSDLVLGQEEGGGIQVLREVKARLPGVPVILITAFAALENVKAGLNEGAAFLLEKPFKASELLSIIQRVTNEQADVSHMVERALAPAQLTEKELSIARLMLKGLTSNEIARLEDNSDKTIRQHITRIYTKCGVSSRPEFFHFVFPW